MKLERLYKQTKTKAIQICDISTNGDTVTVEFGQLDGKMQSKDTICKPKNVGKKNETTGEQQALAEAQSKHKKKIDEGYTLDPSGEVIVMLPMKVQTYAKVIKNVKFPCYASPKLNGVNSLFKLEDGVLNRYSRGGIIQPELVHLTQFVTAVLNEIGTTSVNAELYKHGAFLEDIDSSSKKINDFSSQLELHAFEFPDMDIDYDDKIDILSGSAFLTPEVRIFNSHEELDIYHDECVELGYEGIVIRNKGHIYEYNQRSSTIFKMKKQIDAEFKIIGMNIDKNNHPVLVFDNPKGLEEKHKTFKAKPKGTAEQKLKIVDEFESKYLNNWYKVEMESLSKYMVPAKPIGVCLRDCDESGEPLI